MSTAALGASDSAIIPIQCEPLSLRTLPPLVQQMIEIKQSINHRLDIAGILLTMFDSGNPASQSVHRQIRNCFFEDLVFQTTIPRDPALNSLYMSSPGGSGETSPGWEAYEKLFTELESTIRTVEKTTLTTQGSP